MDELDQKMLNILQQDVRVSLKKLQRPALFHHLQHLLEFKNLKNIV